MDLRQLKQFAVLAEILSFRRAAESLNMAQPALSVSIRRLEDDLGVRLFERSRRGVQLTEAGKAILHDAKLALQAAARVREVAACAAAGGVGTLRISFVSTAAYSLLPRILERLRDTHPGIRVELFERSTDAIIAGLESNRFDVAIVRYPLPAVRDMRLEFVEKDYFCAVLPRGHRLAKRTHLWLRELSADFFLIPPIAESPALHHLVLSACQKAGFMPLLAQQEAIQIGTVLGLVEGGFGVALIPQSLAQHLRRRVVFCRLSDPKEHIETGLALMQSANTSNGLIGHFRVAVSATAARGSEGNPNRPHNERKSGKKAAS
jgi:DNA-binding transcriptional LysR family regulator